MAAAEERRKKGSYSYHPASGDARTCGAERKKLQQQVRAPPGQVYFTLRLALLFLGMTALLVFLPLVLPPLPPPPLPLLLVPVGLMAVLLALAFVPADGRAASAVASSCLH